MKNLAQVNKSEPVVFDRFAELSHTFSDRQLEFLLEMTREHLQKAPLAVDDYHETTSFCATITAEIELRKSILSTPVQSLAMKQLAEARKATNEMLGA